MASLHAVPVDGVGRRTAQICAKACMRRCVAACRWMDGTPAAAGRVPAVTTSKIALSGRKVL